MSCTALDKKPFIRAFRKLHTDTLMTHLGHIQRAAAWENAPPLENASSQVSEVFKVSGFFFSPLAVCVSLRISAP